MPVSEVKSEIEPNERETDVFQRVKRRDALNKRTCHVREAPDPTSLPC
jgi:hypothetical protein